VLAWAPMPWMQVALPDALRDPSPHPRPQCLQRQPAGSQRPRCGGVVAGRRTPGRSSALAPARSCRGSGQQAQRHARHPQSRAAALGGALGRSLDMFSAPASSLGVNNPAHLVREAHGVRHART